jgi:hypothetical protein
MLSGVSHVVIYFPLYEWMKEKRARVTGTLKSADIFAISVIAKGD